MSGVQSLPSVAAPTLAGLLWPVGPDGQRAALRAVALMVAGSLLLTLSAKIQVPLPPVPMTLQTLVVLLIGAGFGWRLGGATVALYLAQGFAGLPVFAGAAAGPLYFAGPTGGFLVGFVAAAVVTGALAERGWLDSLPRVVALMALGHGVIFAFGLGWLSALIGPGKAWAAGAAPFVAATVLKTALAAALLRAGSTFARR